MRLRIFHQNVNDAIGEIHWQPDIEQNVCLMEKSVVWMIIAINTNRRMIAKMLDSTTVTLKLAEFDEGCEFFALEEAEAELQAREGKVDG